MNTSIIEKVRKLLVLAENAGTPAEAEVASAHAEKIIAKYALDLALVQEKRGDKGKPTSIRVEVDNPYATGKSALLNVIAKAYDCSAIRISKGTNTVIRVFGYQGDLEAVELLYASLSLQAVSAMAQTPVPPCDNARSFRHSFTLGFAGVVGRRLQDTRRQIVEESGVGSALVLRSRAADAQAALREEYSRITQSRSSSSSSAGRAQGQHHGGRADLGQSRFAGSAKSLH